MTRLAGAVALITGGASGLGAASARRFVEEGCRVSIADLNDAAGAALAAELGENCSYVHADHTERSDNEAAVAHTERAFGSLDILYNNAGARFPAPSIRSTTSRFRALWVPIWWGRSA